MKEKKDLDRLFREQFRDFEKNPDERVWKNIKRELQGRKKRGLAIWPLWTKIAGAAAVLALLFFVGNLLFTSGQPHPAITSGADKSVDNVQDNPENTEQNTKAIGGVAKSQTNKPAKSNIENPTNPLSANAKNKASNNGMKSTKTHASGLVKSERSENVSAKGLSSTKKHQDKPASTENPSKTGNLTVDHKESDKPVEQKESVPAYIAKTILNSDESNSSEKVENSVQKPVEPDAIAQNQGSNGESYSSKENGKPIGGNADSPKANSTQKRMAKTEENSDNGTKKDDESGKKSIFEAIAKQKQQESEDSKKGDDATSAKFSIRPNVAPIYYSSLNGGSGIDQKFSNNGTDGEVTMSYGIDLSYALSERVKIRSGINRVNMSYNTTHIAFGSSPSPQALTGLNGNHQMAQISVVQNLPAQQISSEVKGNPIENYMPGSLNQQIAYIEVPFEIEYTLLNKRFSIDLIGGASTLFLQDDATYINSAVGTLPLGEANNINSVSFTTNIGFGLGYDLTEKLNFSVEPMFKYQLNGFSGKTGGFEPYYLGVYTGLSFTF